MGQSSDRAIIYWFISCCFHLPCIYQFFDVVSDSLGRNYIEIYSMPKRSSLVHPKMTFGSLYHSCKSADCIEQYLDILISTVPLVSGRGSQLMELFFAYLVLWKHSKFSQSKR